MKTKPVKPKYEIEITAIEYPDKKLYIWNLTIPYGRKHMTLCDSEVYHSKQSARTAANRALATLKRELNK